MTDTIVVTGAAGYIGSHTVIELLAQTHYEVIAIDNFSNSNASAYQRIQQIISKSFVTIEVDVCDYSKLSSVLKDIKNIKGIIHFAAYKSVPESMNQPLLYYNNNIASLNNMLQLCEEKNIPHFIFSSSCSVYGNTKDLPVTEATPMQKAESPYGHTKQIGEEIIHAFANANKDFSACLLRYFNPVGAHVSGKIGELPLNRPNNLVPIITQTAVGKNRLTVFGNDYDTRDGSCIRDYIHVSDIANAHVKALQYLSDNKNREAVSLFNLGTGNGVSVLEAIQAFEKVSGQKLAYTVGARRAGDVVAIYANNELAKMELNWQLQYNLEDMMASAWKWQMTLEKEE
jgi:UDP-glucose 4-epimerase